MSTRSHLLAILFLTAITLLIYISSFSNSFIYDDHLYVADNDSIRHFDSASLRSFFVDRTTVSSDEGLSRDVWRPLVTASFAADYALWALRERFYHIENVAIHIANVLLVYMMTVMILGSGFAALVAASIFAIHPVQTEAVTWISGRCNLVFAFFFLLSCIFHIRQMRANGGGFDRALCLAFFFFSLLSKEMAITLPLVLLLYDVQFSKREKVSYYLGAYVPFFLIGALYVIARFSVLGVIAQTDTWWGGDLYRNAMIMLKVLLGYLRLLIWPLPLKAFYLIDAPRSMLERGVLASCAALSFIIAASFILRRRKATLFYVLWFFITLLPVYNIIPIAAAMGERFLYIPLLGFASLAGMVASEVKKRTGPPGKTVLYGALILLSVWYGTRTVARNAEWADDITFYAHEIARSPDDPKPHYNLGWAYRKAGEKNGALKDRAAGYYGLALGEYGKARALAPTHPLPYRALADTYVSLGMHDQVIKNYRASLALKADGDVYNNLGLAYYRAGRYDEAIRSFRSSLLLKPSFANAYINLGNAYFKKREYVKARKAWLTAARSGGGSGPLMRNIEDLKKLGY